MEPTRTPTLRENLLRAALVFGVSIGLGTEILGASHAITFSGVLGFWLAGGAAAAAFLAWRRRRDGPAAPIRVPRLARADALLVAGLVLLALLLLFVAVLAPPQSSDSIGYHMTRVMHWIQNRSLSPYPTRDTPQLFDPPLAEMIRLHLFLLTGSDRAGCLLQWFAAIGCLLASSLIARDLGGGRRAQILAAVFSLTLPIGITQATAGKNGWVETLWLLELVYFSGAAAPEGIDPRGRGGIVAAFAALGLGLMTKVSTWFFAFPVAVLAILRASRLRLRRVPVGAAVAGVLLAGALTLPFLARNLLLFGNPVADTVSRVGMGVGRKTAGAILSNAVRNAMFQFGSRSPAVNRALQRGTVGALGLIGVDAFDRRTSIGWFEIRPPRKVEEVAISPLHILLLLFTGVALVISRRLRAGRARPAYFAAVVAGFLIFCAMVRWQAPNCRLLMPLLVLAAPLVAVVADEAMGRAAPALGILLVAAGVPYAVGTVGRPLSFEPGKGILATPRVDLYFARFPELRGTYQEIARVVRTSGVRNLGIVYPRKGQPEYLLWVLLRDAGPPVRIEEVAVSGPPGDLAQKPPFRDFRPELVVVFAPIGHHPESPPRVLAAGTKYSFVRSAGFAGFYTR